jgi:hypothetical protein
LLGDPVLRERMEVDLDRMDARHQVLFRFLDRVNTASATLTAGEVAGVREAGWTDQEIYFAVTVCALFNFYNRWIDATGVHGMSDLAHRVGGKRLAANGYVAAAPRVAVVGGEW